MTDLAGQFEDLKNEIQKVREKGYEQTEIIQKSESFFNTCDEATGLAVPQEHFVGRDGGDEFLALLYGLDHKGVQKSLKMIRTQTAEYSEQHPEMPISYAVGYALSTDFEGSNLRELFRLADKNMYVDKNRAKMEEAAEVQRQNYALLDDIKAKGCQFTDCVYCDALLDEYRVLRASTGFFLAEDGSYSGAVEQVVQELSNDENRKELWKSLQLPYLGEKLSEQENKLELSYSGADEKMQLMQYYDQMKQSILENGKYVDALLETAEAVYTVNLTEDTLENTELWILLKN